MLTSGYYISTASNYQTKPRWRRALIKSIVDKLVNDGSNPKKLRRKRNRRRKAANKVENVLARPKGWHQLHGSPWLDDYQKH
jgi:hypothetical protein